MELQRRFESSVIHALSDVRGVPQLMALGEIGRTLGKRCHLSTNGSGIHAEDGSRCLNLCFPSWGVRLIVSSIRAFERDNMEEHAPGDCMDELMGDCFPNQSALPSGNWEPLEVQQHEHPVVDMGDWRAQVSPDIRNKVVKHIMATLKKHLTISGQTEFSDLPMVAKRFEEKVYFSSASKCDYFKKIKLKMMTVDAASHNNMNCENISSQNASQPQIQGQSFPVSVEKSQFNMLQQFQQKDISNNITSFRMQNPSSSRTAQSSLSNLKAAHLPHGVIENVSMNNNSGVPQNATGVPSMFVSSLGMQPVQQLAPQQQLYTQQSQQHPLKKNLQQANISHALMQPYSQQGQLQQHQIHQQQLQSQGNMLQSSQQYFLQTSSSVQPTLLQPTQIYNSLQLNQQPLHQLTRSLLPQQQPTIPRPRQQQQASFISPKKTPALQQPNQMLPQQVVAQQKAMRCPSDIAKMQQNQSGQLNYIPEIQQRQQQKQGFLGPQSSLASIQLQQQPLILSQENQYLNLEQQHATLSDKSIRRCAAEGSMLNQSRVSGQDQQNMPTLQSAKCQLRNAQHLTRIQPPSLQKHLSLKQQSVLLQEGLQPGNPQFELLEQRNLIHQQMQISQPHGILPDLSSNSLECVDQSQDGVGSSLQEAIYQKLKAMKDLHLPMLCSLYNQLVAREMVPNTSAERQKAYNDYKVVLEHVIRILNTPKNCITPSHEAMLEFCEKQIAKLRNLQNARRPTTSLQQAQQPQFQTTQVQQSENQINSLLLSQPQNSQNEQGNLINPMPHINSGPLRHSLYTNQHARVSAVTSQTGENLLHMKPQPMHRQQQQMHRQEIHQAGLIGEALKQSPLSSEHTPYRNQLHQTASAHYSGNTSLVDLSTPLKPSVSSQSPPLLAATPASFSAPLSAKGTEKPNATPPSLPEVPPPNASETLPDTMKGEELPIDRLVRAINLLSPRALKESLNDLKSVVIASDKLVLSVPGDGVCEAAKTKRYLSAVSASVILSGANDSSVQQACGETSEMRSPATPSIKQSRYASVLEDIREINSRLIDTVLDVCYEDAGEIGDCEGMVVQCSFVAVAMSKELKSHYTSDDVLPIQPLRLLVPSDYPASSPILLDQRPSEASGMLEDLSSKAKSKIHDAMRGVSQSSLGEVAKMWEDCCHQVILEYVQKTGGGTFTSQYGAWEVV